MRMEHVGLTVVLIGAGVWIGGQFLPQIKPYQHLGTLGIFGGALVWLVGKAT